MKNEIYKIEIDDLTIRCFEEADAPLIKDAIDTSLEHLRTFMSWAHKEPLPLKTKVEKVLKFRNNFIENKDFVFAVLRGDKFLGAAGIHTRLEGNALELGYWIRADEIKKGITTKAVVALTKVAFEHIKVDHLEVHLFKNNIPSFKIPEKLHYKRMLDYTDETKDDSSWFKMDKELYLSEKKHLETFYDEICFKFNTSCL